MVVNISKRIKRELFQKQSYTDKGVEEEGVYKVTLEYLVKWQKPMRSLQLAKLSSRNSRKATKHDGPSGVRDQTGSPECIVISDDSSDQDLIDLIGKDEDGDVASDEQVTKQRVPDVHSDSDSCCSLDSIASGPSLQQPANFPVSLPPGLCAGCLSLYREASKERGRHQNTVRDKDPSSLSCDEWVLQKKWKPRRQKHFKGRLWTHLKMISQRLQSKKQKSGQCQQPACSRPHIILQRNLKQCVRQVAAKGRKSTSKTSRKRRSREAGYQPQVAKKQRLHSDRLHSDSIHSDSLQSDSQNDSPPHSSSFNSNPGPVSERKQENLKQGRRALNFESSPPVVMDCPEMPTVSVPKTMPKKGGFRDLLAQLRGAGSAIVRESRT